jgi:para-nitrobenzyl esterase
VLCPRRSGFRASRGLALIASLACVSQLLLPRAAGSDAPVLFRDPQFSIEVTSPIEYGQGAVQPAPATVSLLLDLYSPIGVGVPTLLPGLILVHGGGFTQGSRTQAEIVQIASELASRGYVVASIDYRVAGDAPISSPEFQIALADASAASTSLLVPAAIAGVEDATMAYRWMVDNAASLAVDTTRIAIGGASAGAIIAVEVAATLDDHGIENVPQLRAVVDLWGKAWPLGEQDLEAGEPPIISIHGELDTRIPLADAVALRDRAEAVGVPFEFHPIAGAGHSFDSIDIFALEAQPGVTLFDRCVEFLRFHLDLVPHTVAVPALSPGMLAALSAALCLAGLATRRGNLGARRRQLSGPARPARPS